MSIQGGGITAVRVSLFDCLIVCHGVVMRWSSHCLLCFRLALSSCDDSGKQGARLDGSGANVFLWGSADHFSRSYRCNRLINFPIHRAIQSTLQSTFGWARTDDILTLLLKRRRKGGWLQGFFLCGFEMPQYSGEEGKVSTVGKRAKLGPFQEYT